MWVFATVIFAHFVITCDSLRYDLSKYLISQDTAGQLSVVVNASVAAQTIVNASRAPALHKTGFLYPMYKIASEDNEIAVEGNESCKVIAAIDESTNTLSLTKGKVPSQIVEYYTVSSLQYAQVREYVASEGDRVAEVALIIMEKSELKKFELNQFRLRVSGPDRRWIADRLVRDMLTQIKISPPDLPPNFEQKDVLLSFYTWYSKTPYLPKDASNAVRSTINDHKAKCGMIAYRAYYRAYDTDWLLLNFEVLEDFVAHGQPIMTPDRKSVV